MSAIDGRWQCSVASPMGEQSFVLTITSGVMGWTGRVEGDMGGMDIDDGSLSGDTIGWAMRVPKPMPITLNCEATIDGDTLAGKVSAGIFGSFPVTGTRIA